MPFVFFIRFDGEDEVDFLLFLLLLLLSFTSINFSEAFLPNLFSSFVTRIELALCKLGNPPVESRRPPFVNFVFTFFLDVGEAPVLEAVAPFFLYLFFQQSIK